MRRQGAKCDNSTDDTAAINQAADIVRQAAANEAAPGYIEFRGPSAFKVSSSLDSGKIDVFGYGEGLHIQATNAQFDVITSTGSRRETLYGY